jgi:hypothetical protein
MNEEIGLAEIKHMVAQLTHKYTWQLRNEIESIAQPFEYITVKNSAYGPNFIRFEARVRNIHTRYPLHTDKGERFVKWLKDRDEWIKDAKIISQTLCSLVASLPSYKESADRLYILPRFLVTPIATDVYLGPDISVSQPNREEAVARWGEDAVLKWERIAPRVAFYRAQELL